MRIPPPRAAVIPAALLALLALPGCTMGVEASPSVRAGAYSVPKDGAIRSGASVGVGFQGGVDGAAGPGADAPAK